MKKSGFLKSKAEIKKSFQSAIIESFEVAAGTLAGGFMIQTIKDKVSNNLVQKMSSPVIAVLGVAANITMKNPHIKAIGHGLTAAGTIQTVFDLAPEKMSSKIGFQRPKALSGPEQETITDEQIIAMQQAAERAYNETINGTEENELIELDGTDKAIADFEANLEARQAAEMPDMF